VPALVEVRCEPTGITVPVASVRPERDGLHIRILNRLSSTTVVKVEGPRDWSSGEIPVEPGETAERQPVPPGALTIGCEIGGVMQKRRVDLVDPSGYYREPELACDPASVVELSDLPVHPPSNNIISAARAGLDTELPGGTDGLAIGPVRGYVSQRLGDDTTDPVVQVAKEGEVVAFAHVRGDGGSADPPWRTVATAEVCEVLLSPSAGAEPPGTTTTEQPDTQSPPP
jgi:hypothetical protein